MRQRKITPLTELMQQSARSELGRLAETARALVRVQELLCFYLDSRLQHQVQVASYKDGTLTVVTSNSTVASQLRYLSRIYLQQLGQHPEFSGIHTLKTVTQTAPNRGNNHKSAHLPPLSAETGGLLLDLAADLGPGEVSEALLRLARHAIGHSAEQENTKAKHHPTTK